MKFVLLYELEVLDELAIIVTEIYDETDVQQNFEPYRLCDEDEVVELHKIILMLLVLFDKTELLEDELEIIGNFELVWVNHQLEDDTEPEGLVLVVDYDEGDEVEYEGMLDLNDTLSVLMVVVYIFTDDLERDYVFDEHFVVYDDDEIDEML